MFTLRELQQMHLLPVTYPLPCTFRISASHVPGHSHCIDAWGIPEEQALLHDHLFLKDCTVNAEEITCRILTAKSRSMGFPLKLR